MAKIVKFSRGEVPEVSEEEVQEALAFEDTDVSDLPELTPEQLAQMRPGRFRPAVKAKTRRSTDQKVQLAN